MKFCFFILSLSTSFTASANQLNYLKREIQKSGYILYKNPLSHSGAGTMTAGAPNSMSIIADPQSCFPDMLNEQPTNLRSEEETDLPSISKVSGFDGTIALDLLKMMNNGNSLFTIGLGVNTIQSIDLSFEGARIERLNLINLEDFYNGQMTEKCKKTLAKDVGFVSEALKVDKMRFSFKDKTGAYIKLSMEGISEYLDINLDVKYHIEHDYELVIESPKYIGYQLGKFKTKNGKLKFYQSRKTFLNRYLYKASPVFKNQ